ncbi:hypothetical protein [Chengkuizengella sediminis]|uniref:hypothetical protein n=1 Tax=Chengkuizengella sediminis TaxID=1885917 RepID=UPI00138945B1|nr:hypothetical protein [Chengkuizengella sediminis]NDI36355.1 hypothetical protein [Chengkuizengella sediminis]
MAHVYYNEQGLLSFKKIPSEEIIALWKDAAHTILDAVIRAYDIEVYEGKAKKTITKVVLEHSRCKVIAKG